MISDSSFDKYSKSSYDIDIQKNLSNSIFSNDFNKKIISSNNLNLSPVSMNLQENTNQTLYAPTNIGSNQPQEEKGVFSRLFYYIKSAFIIEEEEFIDAHGFKAKRPRQKMPLRKKEDKLNSSMQMIGGQSMTYATQHSGFGNLFL